MARREVLRVKSVCADTYFGRSTLFPVLNQHLVAGFIGLVAMTIGVKSEVNSVKNVGMQDPTQMDYFFVTDDVARRTSGSLKRNFAKCFTLQS